MDSIDDQLVSRLREGDEDAFTDIYSRYWKLLFYVAGKRLNNHTQAEEAVQNVFTDLWARRATIAIKKSLKYYLAAAVQYQVISQLSRRPQLTSLDNPQHSISATPADQRLSFHELEKQIQDIVSALPEKCRLVYTMSRDQGLSNRAIAQELGISEKTVENQLTKALSRIRGGLGDEVFALFLLCFFHD